MTDPTDKSKRPGPRVEVIRKGPAAPVASRPVAPVPVPRPVGAPTAPAPRPASPVVPSPVVPRAPGSPDAPVAPSPAARAPRAAFSERAAPRGGGFRAPASPRPPPTPEAIAALAARERVPNRIAKGELEGKMKCRIWKKLHAEEAQRFDQAFTLVQQHPKLELTDAFGVVQSGLPVDEFLARRARAKKRDEVKKARSAVDAAPIDAFIQGLIDEKAELSIVLGERTALDVLTAVQPVAFEGERSGRVEKLQVVLLARRTTWEALAPQLDRDARLTQKPTPVARQPARRPVNDPRPMLDAIGKDVRFVLRNGLTLTQRLDVVGPYDVLVGGPAAPLFIPLHAMLSWAPADGGAPAGPAA